MYKFDQIKSQNHENTPEKSLALFFGLFFFGLFFGNIIASAIVLLPHAGFEVSRYEYMMSNLDMTCSDIYLCHALQGAFMIVTFFIIPFAYLQLFEKKDFSFLSHPKISAQSGGVFFVLSFILILAIYPISLKLREFTILGIDQGFFGSFGTNMKTYENSQETLIEAMINVSNVGEFISLLIIIAVLPAIGEELVFRGVFQSLLVKITSNPFVAIFVTALLFSALHISLTDFVPRLLLGSVLGIAYYYSKNIWVPIALHFTNNALSVFYYLGLRNKQITFDVEASGNISALVIVVSLAIFLLVLIQLNKFSKTHFSGNKITLEE